MKTNTILGLELFKDEIKNQFIFHIPHSSITIPFYTEFINNELVEKEIQLTTDWKTTEIFNVKDIDKVFCDFSRVFCDVERLNDNEEELFKFGRGFFYTKTDNNESLREDKNNIKELIYNEYYLKHHNRLNTLVENKLKEHNSCYIVDCHSFNDIPLNLDLNKDNKRPDICLGIDEFHTPKYLLEHFYNHFKTYNYSVEINNPYSGTIIPSKYYKNDKRVKGIMIEINKKLYIKNNIILDDKVNELNRIVTELFEF
jgi:N-formylglutamate amidohydrolase